MAKRAHWFHCTERFRGAVWTAERISPVFIPDEEPKTPRLCVGENVVRCFAARLFQRTVYVYRTETMRRAVKPFNVADECLTGERWLVPPVRMIHVGTIPEPIVRQASKLTIIRMRANGWTKGLTMLQKMQGFQEASEALGPEWCPPHDLKMINILLEWWKKR